MLPDLIGLIQSGFDLVFFSFKSPHSPASDAPYLPTLGGFPYRVHQLPAFPSTRLPSGLVWSLALVFE
jgi:hypothetical protein